MFTAELPLPVVREAIAGLLKDAGIDAPDGALVLRTFQPSKDKPEGVVQVQIYKPGKAIPE